MMDYTIRLAREADKDQLIQFRCQASQEIATYYNEKLSNDFAHNVRDYIYEQLGKNLILWVAEEQSKIISMGGLNIFYTLPCIDYPTGKRGEVCFMYTLPEYRKQGIGTEILTLIIEYINQQNILYPTLLASDDGRGMYEKAGFQTVTYEMFLDNRK